MPDKIYLENDHLKVAVLKQGAELCSFFSKNRQAEYLWQADKAYWGRHAPVLFPIVGRLKNNKYLYEGKTYTLPQHGFARDMAFHLLHADHHRALYALYSQPETEQVYPFQFELHIEYRLEESGLQIHYTVRNSGDSAMYFSIGAHPAFNCPLSPGEQAEDYALYFEQEEYAQRHHIREGLQNGEHSPVLEGSKELVLTDNLFEQDAVIFKNLRSQSMFLLNRKTRKGLEICFPSFPYLGIWSKPGAAFVCIEPWQGITDSKDSSGELTAKEGMIRLQPNQIFHCVYTIRIV